LIGGEVGELEIAPKEFATPQKIRSAALLLL